MKRENTERVTIDQLMQSLDHIKRADAGDFFYSKVRGKLEVEQSNVLINNRLRPSFIIASLSLLLLLNWVSISQVSKPIANHGEREKKVKLDPGVWELKEELVGVQNFSYE